MSEAASPPGRDPEPEIDLGAVDRPVPAQAPGPSPPRRYPRIPNAALAYAAIAIALAAAVVITVKSSPLHRPLAESTVASFLEAVREGDVEGALDHTDQEDVTGEFLVPEALDPRWEIATVAQVDYEARSANGRAVAQVYAEIEAHDGTRIGHRYRVEIEHGRAEIVDAMRRTTATGTFDFVDLNGVRVELDSDTASANVMLLPGLYEFYPDLPSTMALEGEGSMLALGDLFVPLGGDVPDEWMPTPWPVLTQEGEDAVSAALRGHYDACTADPSGDDCPFAFPEDPERELAPAPGAAWEIVSYPTVEVGLFWYEYGSGFGLETAVPGEARVLAQVTEDGRERTALVSCPIWVDGLYAVLDFEGGAAIANDLGSAEEHCRSVVEVE